MKELFNMANCNTMLALAYIQESENPLHCLLYTSKCAPDEKVRPLSFCMTVPFP